MDIQIVILQMGQLFLIMLLGYFIYKIKLVDNNFVGQFTKLILNVTMPCMVLGSVLKLEERQALGDVLAALFTAVILFFVVLPVIGWLISKLLFVKKKQEGLYVFMNTFPNVGFMGFPIISALCGTTGLFYAAIFNLIFNISLYTLGVWLVSKDTNNGASFNLKQLCSSGVILAIFALIVYFLNINLPSVIDEAVYSVGSITSPSAMFLIGCSLAKMDIKRVFNDWRVYVWTLIKQLAIPLMLWVPLTYIIKNELVLYVAYILFSMPVANAAVLLATNYNGDTELAAKTVFITTLFSLVSVPVCVLMVV